MGADGIGVFEGIAGSVPLAEAFRVLDRLRIDIDHCLTGLAPEDPATYESWQELENVINFNQAIEPVSQAVGEALADYNGILEKARALASSIAEPAQEQFDAKSERWQESDKGIEVRSWIEQWEVSLDEVDLELPEPLEEIDPDEQAGEIEGAPPNPWSERAPVIT